MEKLNELVELAERADSVGIHRVTVNPHTILTIAEAFRELERRAEAAEVESARLMRNYNHVIEQHMPRTSDGCDKGWTRVIEAHELQAKLEAAEAKLAELVPDAADPIYPTTTVGDIEYRGMCDGWNACRAEMLRKIEES